MVGEDIEATRVWWVYDHNHGNQLRADSIKVTSIEGIKKHYTLLERNLIYTGVIRGKLMVILLGQKKTLFMAVNHISAGKRITILKQKIGKRS